MKCVKPFRPCNKWKFRDRARFLRSPNFKWLCGHDQMAFFLLILKNETANSPDTNMLDMGFTLDGACTSIPGWSSQGNAAHLVQFYEDDSFLIDTLSSWFDTGLKGGGACIYIGTAPHRQSLEQRMGAKGVALDSMRETGRLLCLDAATILSRLLVNGWPERSHFIQEIEERVRAASCHGNVRVFGEMVALLWRDGKWREAVRLEEIWNDFIQTHPIALCSAYPINDLSAAATETALQQLGAMHSIVIPAESYTALNSPAERLRSIAVLQQKARMLEAEAARREAAERLLHQHQEKVSQLEAQLRAKNAELAQADRQKNEFVAMLGHELRNPLSGVSNAVATAEIDNSRRERALSIAHRQVNQLSGLVDDLLDFERIDKGRIALKREVIRLANIVRLAVEETQSQLGRWPHRLSILISPQAEGALIDADPTRLRQVISNLLHNAAKFTPAEGRIEISVNVEGDEVTLRVCDSGIGIAPEMLPRVFDLFTQAEISLDRKNGGLGIGLTLVKQLVEMHGGRVQARSSGLGKGSEFEIRLPVLPDACIDASPVEDMQVTFQPARILIVEDNTDASEALSMLLENFGHHPTAVENGVDAIAAVTKGEFDFALVDIGLPGIDGYELARRIRALPNGRNLTLVALTGYGQESDKRQARVAGFDHHLTKPVNIARLRALLGG